MEEKIDKPTAKPMFAGMVLTPYDETLEAFICDAHCKLNDNRNYVTPCDQTFDPWSKLYCPQDMYKACQLRGK